ncbi:hypothetical protein HMI56_003468, partial [Coelomomyces lativittatus]
LNAEAKDAWMFYPLTTEVLYVPTSMSEHGLDRCKQWYYKYIEAFFWQGVAEKQRILNKTFWFGISDLKDYRLYIDFQYGQEN